VWKGTAYRNDIEKVLIKFLGDDRTKRAMNIFNVKYNVDKNEELADARLIKFSENLLTGHIGTASAKILISSVVKEEKITLPEVLKILEESKENIIINKKLTETSNELKEISEVLAAEFKLSILNKKEFKKAKAFSEELKKRFFGDIFGDNKECNDFALWLLKNKKKELFLKFRDLFWLMSKSIDSKELIYKFCEEKNLIYGKYSDEVKSKKAKDNAEKIKNKRFEDGEFDSTKTLPVNSGCLGFFSKRYLNFCIRYYSFSCCSFWSRMDVSLVLT
jgi:hypothetical protein